MLNGGISLGFVFPCLPNHVMNFYFDAKECGASPSSWHDFFFFANEKNTILTGLWVNGFGVAESSRAEFHYFHRVALFLRRDWQDKFLFLIPLLPRSHRQLFTRDSDDEIAVQVASILFTTLLQWNISRWEINQKLLPNSAMASLN